MKNLLLLLLITIVGVSCEKYDEPIIDNTSALDKLFTNGFDMSLEQVYVMSANNTIPYMDYATDSCFKTTNDIVTINNFQNYNDTTKLLSGIVKGENWNVSKMIKRTDTTYVERGFNENYYVQTNTNTKYYNVVKCNNVYTNRIFIISYVVGDVYTPRGRDNHTFNMNYVDLSTNVAYKSNLYFEVLTKDGNGLFNGGKYVYFDTNMTYKITYQLTAPLTGSEVKAEIEKGNYVLFLWHNMTTYRIGDNLYVPRYSSYAYVGNVNGTGSITYLKTTYYRFKFLIK